MSAPAAECRAVSPTQADQPPSCQDNDQAPAIGVLFLCGLALLSAVSPLATDMYLPAFPQVSEGLNASATQVQLTLTTFMVGMAAGQLLFGPLSDRFGRRPLLVVGTVTCLVASVLCALAPNVTVLVILRLFQGLGGSAGPVLARAMVSDVAKGIRAAQVFGILMTIGGIAPIAAPMLGAVLLGAVGWRGILGTLAAMSIAMLVCALVIRETLPPGRRHQGGIGTTLTMTRGFLGNRVFTGYLCTLVFAFGMLFAYVSASSFVLQDVFELSAGQYSAVFGSIALMGTIVGGVNAKIVSRISPRTLLTGGLAAQLTAVTALSALAVTGSLTLPTLIPLLMVSTATIGFVLSNATTLAIAEVPHAAGTASAVIGALQFTIAASVSPLVSLGGATAVPMALTMFVSSALACAGFLLIARPASRVARPAR